MLQRSPLKGLGSIDIESAAVSIAVPPVGAFTADTTISIVAGLIGAGLGAFHGFRRNNSALAALGWGLFGASIPILSVPISLAQGFGKPKKRR
jgi:hypothetical protein